MSDTPTYSLAQSEAQPDPRPFATSDHNGFTEPAEETPAPAVTADDNLFPVVLLHNYRPLGAYHVPDTDQHLHGEPTPVQAGTIIRVPKDEAKQMIAAKVAARADTLE